MNIQKCEDGHFYDADQSRSCPLCAANTTSGYPASHQTEPEVYDMTLVDEIRGHTTTICVSDGKEGVLGFGTAGTPTMAARKEDLMLPMLAFRCVKGTLIVQEIGETDTLVNEVPVKKIGTATVQNNDVLSMAGRSYRVRLTPFYFPLDEPLCVYAPPPELDRDGKQSSLISRLFRRRDNK